MAEHMPIEAKVAHVYANLSAIFGELWARRYGEDDTEGVWSAVLHDLSDRQIEGGIRMIRNDWESEWPPTPARFRKWALDSVRPYDVVPDERRLEAKPAQEHVRQEHLDRLKQEFGLAPAEGDR